MRQIYTYIHVISRDQSAHTCVIAVWAVCGRPFAAAAVDSPLPRHTARTTHCCFRGRGWYVEVETTSLLYIIALWHTL